jgi:hypothetical protein
MAEESLREQIMQHLVQRFVDVRANDDGYTTTWNVVVRRPMTKTEIGMGNAIGLYDTEEEKSALIGYYNSLLTVSVEFYYNSAIGDEPSQELNRMLMDVQRCMRSDPTCAGLTFNIVEVRNELDIDGPSDRLVAGMAEFQVSYRHRLDDPRVP